MSLLEFCHIPGGKVRLEKQSGSDSEAIIEVAPFDIARTPLTNAQFSAFVTAGRYTDQQFWSEEGWAARLKYRWETPRYFTDSSWNGGNRPVVGVSYYEAEAFCCYLSQLEGDEILLPSEAQWQRAAQGDDEREYPWGDDPPQSFLCNWARNEDRTTPVDRYDLGVSPYGVLDMGGNVWEWCLDLWRGVEEVEAERRHFRLRGGCWSSDSLLSLRAANRSAKDPYTRQAPHFRDAIVGFRPVRLATSAR